MKSRPRTPISEIDPRQALYELQSYHEELEIQNRELQQIKEQNEILIKKYTTLYNQAPSGYLSLDPLGRILELNFNALNYLGKDRDNLLNTDFKHFISKETLSQFTSFFNNIFEKQNKVSCEAIILSGDNPIPVQFEGISVDNGISCLITMTDITLLKQTENALKLSRKEFQSYFENGSVGMSVSSPGRGWIELNQKFCQMLGYSKEELIGINWMDLSHPEDLQANLDYYNLALQGKLDRYQMDKRFIRKDGQTLFVTLSVACQRNEDGSIHHLLSSYIDITDQKLTETALRKSEEKYRTLLELAPDAFFQGDSNGNFIMVNNKAIEFTAFSKKELLCMNMADLFSAEELKANPLKYNLADTGVNVTTQREVLRKDGKKLLVELNAKKMPDGTYQCLMKDISLRRQAEEALKESEERYRVLFENSPDAIILADVKTGLIIDANRAAAKLTGKRIGDLIGMHHSKLHPARFEETIKNSFQEQSKAKGINHPVQRIIIKSDGKEIPVDILSKVISINRKTVLQGIFRESQQ
jgi:PAS domain S-box-containing protein